MNENDISTALSAYDSEYKRYSDFSEAVSVLAAALVRGASVDLHDVTQRAKDTASLRSKLQSHSEYDSLDHVKDLAGVRIVTVYAQDVDTVCDVLSDEFEVVEDVDHRASSSAE